MEQGPSPPCSEASMDMERAESPAPSTLYDILGVSIMATSDAIRAAYRRLARLWHPDRHRGDEHAKRKFQELQGAYEVLSDTSRRHQYDLNLLEFLDVEEYLSRYQELILTASGLGMSSRENSGTSISCSYAAEPPLEASPRPRPWYLLKAS